MSRNRTRSAAPAPVAHVAPVEPAHVEEIVEQQDTSTPPEAEKPTKPVGTSNLATTIRAHRRNYVVALAPSGKKTANNGDVVAALLLLVPIAELERFVYETFGREYRTRGLNEGHIRMCCGNLVRASWKKDEPKTVEWLSAFAPKPVVEEEEAAA